MKFTTRAGAAVSDVTRSTCVKASVRVAAMMASDFCVRPRPQRYSACRYRRSPSPDHRATSNPSQRPRVKARTVPLASSGRRATIESFTTLSIWTRRVPLSGTMQTIGPTTPDEDEDQQPW